MSALWYVGDALTVLRTLPDASVDLILTSPPFLALRSYLAADDPNKALEMGSEPTPGEFLDALLDVVVECRRVVAPHGSLCIELGDTYAGSGGAGGDYGPAELRAGQAAFDGSASRERYPGGRAAQGWTNHLHGAGWPLDKSLCLIPESFRFALAYGRNPHTGRTLEPWRVRNVVRWCRPNPPVGALADKFRPATSEMVIACTGRSRYFDLDAVRQEYDPETGRTVGTPAKGFAGGSGMQGGEPRAAKGLQPNPAGAPPLDWWRIPTQPYRGSHYATWPEDLCIAPILAMCPQKVCTVCGKPTERVVEKGERVNVVGRVDQSDWDPDLSKKRDEDHAGSRWEHLVRDGFVPGHSYERTTLGWSDCGHNAWRPGIVLDPFAGSGTTGAVAVGHGRHFIGIDLDERNAWLARERLGMFLEVVG